MGPCSSLPGGRWGGRRSLAAMKVCWRGRSFGPDLSSNGFGARLARRETSSFPSSCPLTNNGTTVGNWKSGAASVARPGICLCVPSAVPDLLRRVREAGLQIAVASSAKKDEVDKYLDIEGADAVAVGDTIYDAEAAGTASMAIIGVLCGGFSERSLRRAGCVEIYPGPAGLSLWKLPARA